MQSHKQQTSNHYLFRVLADGAKPFRYRDRVRSLLGVSQFEGDGKNIAFYPMLPPVGFRYVNQTLMVADTPGFSGQSIKTVHRRPETMKLDKSFCGEPGPHDMEDISSPLLRAKSKELRANSKSPLVAEGLLIPCPDEQSQHDPGGAPGMNHDIMIERQKNSMKEKTQQDGGVPGTDQQKAPVEETGKREDIDIPGFSEKSITFPCLSYEKSGTNKEKVTEPQLQGKMEKPVNHTHVSTPGKNQTPGIVKNRATEFQLQGKIEKSTDHKSIPVPFSEKLQKPGTFKEKVTKPQLQGKMEKSTEHISHAGAGKPGRPGIVKTKMTDPLLQDRLEKLLGHTSKPVPAVEDPVSCGDEAACFPGPAKKSQQVGIVKERMAKSQLAGTAPKDEISSPSYRAAALRIEQLRQEVHRLNALNAGGPAPSSGVNREIKEEEQLPIPGPPVQPVVVVRQSSRQRRVSCAFWERSYLGRFRMRTLR